MSALSAIFAMLVFPCGLFLLLNSIVYEWVDHKLIARLQNRLGPRWFQPFADILKLLAKETVAPEGVNRFLFVLLPLIALAGVMTAALYVPLIGLAPVYSFPGDLIVTIYLLSLLSICVGIAGTNTRSSYSIIGVARMLTQFFAYEAPFMLALLGPALVAGSWQIGEITARNGASWLLFTQPLGFAITLLSLMGKVEMPPFDAPEAGTEIVAGALTEYGGPGLALILLARKATLLIGLTLTAAFYMGGLANPLDYVIKTLLLLALIVVVQALTTRFKIDHTASLWWRFGMLLIVAQWAVIFLYAGG